jgi:4-hydroxy-tetrahydrodipicolinate synthase
MDPTRRIDPAALERYAARLAVDVDGVCVWAHTGRGLALPVADRARVLATFRAAVDGPVLAGVGPAGASDAPFTEQVAATVRMAEAAAAGGADGLMVFPAPGLRPAPTRAARTIRLHEAVVAATGLPVLGFLLYPEAGGVAYGPALLRDLVSLPGVAGVKLATLYQAVDCQDGIDAIHAAGGLAVTGEDRMFGPSLTWGADAALVGVAAAAPALSRALVRAWFDGDAARFLAASRAMDRFAARIFRDPMDGYVQRMLWVAEREGLVDADAAADPYGTALGPAERDAARAAYEDAVARPRR